jgi:excisionase family DNA binding protein
LLAVANVAVPQCQTTTLRLVPRRGRPDATAAGTAPRARTLNVTVRTHHRILLSVEDAAERLDIGRTMLYELISAGEIHAIHVGRLGLTGVKLVTSDAHAGLVAALGANLPGATWQRCRTPYAANLMSVCPKTSWPAVKAMLHSVYDQPEAKLVHAQFDKMLDQLTGLCRTSPSTWTPPAPTSWRSPRPPRICGVRSGRTIPTSA